MPDGDTEADWRAQSESLLMRNQCAEALDLYTRILEAHPDESAAWVGKARALLCMNRHDEALIAANQALTIDPEYAEGYRARGNSFYWLKRYDEALAAADKALALDPESGVAWDLKGRILSELKRNDESLACFDRAIELVPNDGDIWNNKGLFLMRDEHYDEALLYFDRAIELNTGDKWPYVNRAIDLLRLGQNEDGLTACERALAIAPNSNEAWETKGNALTALGLFDEALVAFDRALELDPENMTTWYNKAGCLKDLDRNEEALAAYDRALALAPNDADVAGARAGALYNLKRNEEALAAYDRALELTSPDSTSHSSRLLYWKGMTLRFLGRDEEAVACFDAILVHQPDNQDAIAERAGALYRLGRLGDALVAYDDALAVVSPDDPKGLNYWKGRTLLRLKQDNEALASFERSLTIAPNDNDGWYWKGITLFALRRYAEALASFDHAIQLAPDDADSAEYKAHTLFSLKRYDEALTAYDRAVELDPKVRDLWYCKGMSLTHLNRTEEAVTCFSRALKLMPGDTLSASARAKALHSLRRIEKAHTHGTDDTSSADRAKWWHELVRSCIELKRYEEALIYIKHATMLDADNADGWFLKGVVLARLGRYQEALAAYEYTLQLDRANYQAWWNKGATLYSLERFDEVLSAYDETIRLRPDDAELRKSYDRAASNIQRTTTDQRLKLCDGRWLGYLDYGDPDGMPVFCCHGTPDSRLAHFADSDLLKDLHIRLIVPDRPGYGLSDFQPHRRLLDWPDDVTQLADHLGIERFAVLGISGGGPHAAACAYAIPQRLTSVGLVSGVTPPELAPLRAYAPRERPSNFIGRYFPWPIQHALYSVPGPIYRRYPGLILYSLYRRSMPLTAEGKAAAKSLEYPSGPLAPVIREQVLEPYRQGARGYAWDIRVYDHPWGFRPEDIHGVEVYLWHGELDPIVPISAARALANAIPGCHATFYSDNGHDAYNRHTHDILTALISGVESEQSASKTSESPQV